MARRTKSRAPKNSTCPLCKGTGKVTAKIARSKITTRNRKAFNKKMREINKRARERNKIAAASAL